MIDERFRKDERIRRRREYLAVQRRGDKLHLQHILAFVLSTDGRRRLGITVSGKVGNAVRRNRIKRLMREAWRRKMHRMPQGLDIVLVAKRVAAQADFTAIAREIDQLGRRLGARLKGDRR